MLRVNEYRLYNLGAKIHPFNESTEGSKFGEVFLKMWDARQALHSFINDAKVPLKICKPSAQNLINALDAIVPSDINQAFASDKDSVITWYQSYTLVEAVSAFETILAAEMQALDTYFVSQKGAFSTYDLIEQAHLAIHESRRSLLPVDAADDFDKAGRCIAFDLATAAGFHLVRATESVIRQYYQVVTGVLPKKKDRNWGAFTKVLEKQPNASARIIKKLKELKDDYRNPILHPEEVLSSAQALDMFNVFVGAASSILEETETLLAKRPSLPFSPTAREQDANSGGTLELISENETA